jgi:hypothetical protein
VRRHGSRGGHRQRPICGPRAQEGVLRRGAQGRLPEARHGEQSDSSGSVTTLFVHVVLDSLSSCVHAMSPVISIYVSNFDFGGRNIGAKVHNIRSSPRGAIQDSILKYSV